MAIRRKSRYLKETSDRSGFDNWSYDGTTFHKEWESTKQGGLKIAPEEYDTPPPSNRPLGGEGDISGTPRANSTFTTSNAETYPPGVLPTVVYVSSGNSIRWNQDPWTQIAGSGGTIDMAVNPQVVLGRQGQVLALECVGSGVLLEHGSGLSLSAGRQYLMDSGSIINLVFSATDNLWHETSRSHRFKSLGEL